jgi:hypothetical protein
MAKGLQDAGRKFGDSVYDPTSEEDALISATSTMREAAKSEVVAAAGKDIADAAGKPGSVRDEMLRQYGYQDEQGGPGLVDRQELERAWSDTTYTTKDSPNAEDLSSEQLYGELKAQQYVDEWAQSAADEHEVSLALQRAAADELDAPSKSFDQYLTDTANMNHAPTMETQEEYSSRVTGLDTYGDQEATMRAFIRGEYDRTQAFLKDNGITEVTLHRGFSGTEPLPEPGNYPIDMNPESSWTVDHQTAVDFATGVYANVLTATFPASDIISTARTGQGALSEGEVLVRNQPGAVAYWGVDDPTPAVSEDGFTDEEYNKAAYK